MSVSEIILSWAAAIIAVGGAFGVVWKLVSPVVMKTRKLLAELERFTLDWFGDEGDAVHPARPGVLARLNKLEGELSKNGGKSVKDTVNRIEQRLEEGNKMFSQLDQRVAQIEEKIDL